MYSQSARDHGTLGYFRGLLHRNTVNVDVKKAVDANLEFLSSRDIHVSSLVPADSQPGQYSISASSLDALVGLPSTAIPVRTAGSR